jgi:hypothetical protein
MEYEGLNGLWPWSCPMLDVPLFDCSGLFCGQRLSHSFLVGVVQNSSPRFLVVHNYQSQCY